MEGKRTPTAEELNLIQSHLSAKDFQTFLKDLEEIHGIEIEENFLDIPTNDPHGYSID